MRSALITGLTILLTSGCSLPSEKLEETIVTGVNREQLLQRIHDLLPQEERSLIARFRVRFNHPADYLPVGRTVREVIERERELERVEQKLSQMLSIRIEKISENVSRSRKLPPIRKTRKASISEDLDEYYSRNKADDILNEVFSDTSQPAAKTEKHVYIRVNVENLGDKEIAAIKGTLTVTDLFKKELSSVGTKWNKPIPAHSSVSFAVETFPDDFRLQNEDLERILVKWKVHAIVFTDSSSLAG